MYNTKVAEGSKIGHTLWQQHHEFYYKLKALCNLTFYSYKTSTT